MTIQRSVSISVFLVAGLVLLAAEQPAVRMEKESITLQMIDLGLQVHALKEGGGDPVVIDQLLARYHDLSEALGGDDPAFLFPAPSGPGGGIELLVAGAPPPGTTPTTANFANNTPVTIVDLTTVTSTITVATADTYLWDVDLRAFITHTFNSDLDMTLTSPAGTVVTISTDNGGSFDNVFNGTTWDDSAATPVTDRVYANNVVATPLTPEGAFARFIGENPNGTWTISIFDDAGADTGSLASWDLNITTLDIAPVNVSTVLNNNTPVAIVDLTTVTSTIVAGGLGTALTNVDLTAFITHTFNSDLDMTLTSPAGTVVTISTDNGGSFDNVFNGTTWDDSAATPVTDRVYANNVVATPLTPEGAFGRFLGENPNGTWTISIFDDAGADTGSLASWSLNLTTGAAPPIVTFCDDSDGSHASCPCGNAGGPGAGCDIQQGTGGVVLSVIAQRTTPMNRATIQGSGYPSTTNPTAALIRAASLDSASPVVFGDGLRCISAPLVRLATTFASGGASNHEIGHGIAAGTYYYQIWFRNQPAMYCTPDAFNMSSGRTIVW